MMRRFRLVRDGRAVAEGCVFSDGRVAVAWLGEHPSSVWWQSLDSAMQVHGHAGSVFHVDDEGDR